MKPSDSITDDEFRKIHTLAVLDRKQGKLKATARTLGIDRKTLYLWLREWGLIKGWMPKGALTKTSAPPSRAATEMTPEQKLRHEPPTLL